MTDAVPSVAARMLVEREIEPRRSRFRKALLRAILTHSEGAGPAGREWTMSRVHELCAEELSDRVRIAAEALRRVYAHAPPVPTESLAHQLKLEVERSLNAELADLARDEHLVTLMLDRLPRLMPDVLPPTDPSPPPDPATAR